MLGAQVGDALDVAAGGGWTPPAPITGSQKNAATRSGPTRRISASSASSESYWTVETSADSGPQLLVLASIPPMLGAEAVRAVVALRAGDQVRALRVPAEHPVAAGDLRRRVDRVAAAGARNTRASSIGATAASRSHSSLAGRLPKSPNVE